MSESEADVPADQRQQLAILTELILQRRPILRELLQKHRDKSLLEYAAHYTDVNLNSPIEQRQEELITVFADSVRPLLGATAAKEAAQQLKQYYVVSTTDHHGPITNPSFCNANLLTAAAYQAQQPALRYVIVLSCASISFRNISFPRGLLFHNPAQPTTEERLVFFPASARPRPVFNWRAYTGAELAEMKKGVTQKIRTQALNNELGERLLQLLEEVYNQPEVLALQRFSEQVTVTNWALFRRNPTAN